MVENKMLKKNGMIEKVDSEVSELYLTLQKRKKEIKQKAEDVRNRLCNGDYCLESTEEKS